MSGSAVTARVQAIAERVASSAGIEIVDTELLGAGPRRVLRVYIDKPGGVTHADCEFISQNVGTILDVEDVVPGGHYTLQVSSPGLERRIAKPREFEKFTGRRVQVVLREPLENQRHWVGTLKGFADGVVTLEPASGKSIRFPLEQVARANLKFEW